jgi:hypothetical protein
MRPPSLRRWLAIVTLSAAAGIAVFVLRVSPLHQATVGWQVYNAMIGPAVALWFLEPTVKRAQLTRAGLLDLVVVGIAAARAVALFPLASGHATFLVYALTCRKPMAWPSRLLMAMTFLCTASFKLWVWHDPASLLAGSALGALCGLARPRLCIEKSN